MTTTFIAVLVLGGIGLAVAVAIVLFLGHLVRGVLIAIARALSVGEPPRRLRAQEPQQS